MMRRFLGLGLATTALTALAAGTALAGNMNPIEMTLSSGNTTVSGLTYYTSSANTVSYSNSDFNGWNIYSPFGGNSNSPVVTPYGIEISGTVAACEIATGCAPLTVMISDTGFTAPVNSFAASLTNIQTGSGSVTQDGYYDSSNTYFGPNGTGGSLIGNPLTLGSSGYESTTGLGPISGGSPYSLTLVETFTTSCTSAGCASFTIGGEITDPPSSVPEPGTLALFGAGLLGFALLLRRRARQRIDH